MKKRHFLCISCMVLTMLISHFSFAQTEEPQYKKHQIAIGAPLLTVQELLTGLSVIASEVGGQDVDDVKGRAAYSLSYRYFPSRRWGVGVTGVYEKIDVYYKNPAAKSTYNTIAILANGQYNHIVKPRFDLYSRLGVGICNFNQTSGNGDVSDNLFAFQVTAIGIRAGGVFNTFVEAGFGYEGLIHAGFSLRF